MHTSPFKKNGGQTPQDSSSPRQPPVEPPWSRTLTPHEAPCTGVITQSREEETGTSTNCSASCGSRITAQNDLGHFDDLLDVRQRVVEDLQHFHHRVHHLRLGSVEKWDDGHRTDELLHDAPRDSLLRGLTSARRSGREPPSSGTLSSSRQKCCVPGSWGWVLPELGCFGKCIMRVYVRITHACNAGKPN